MLEKLRDEGVSPALIEEIEAFRAKHQCPAELLARIPAPRYMYYGTEVWEQAITALLCGENLLLSGPKATGKNVLAECLAAAFGRPAWDISLHINTDSAALIGTDTLHDGSVTLRRGPIYQCAVSGGFGILDEVNMAKNEALAVLHATLDFRRIIDVPGYERIGMDGAARFIATMNYGYAGTRELNEALASRFMVLEMPNISEENLRRLLRREFPTLKSEYMEQFAALFEDILKKSGSAEISTKAVDLRGLLAAITLMAHGLDAFRALRMGLANKTFDDFERGLVEDIIRLRIPDDLTGQRCFE